MTDDSMLHQELRELTGTEHDDLLILFTTYRNQYTRGWNKSREGRDLASTAPEAEQDGYGDYGLGVPKWAAMNERGFLVAETAAKSS